MDSTDHIKQSNIHTPTINEEPVLQEGKIKIMIRKTAQFYKNNLDPTTTKMNFFSYLTCVTFSICFVVYLNQAQAMVLINILQLDKKLGDVTGKLAFYDELVSLIFVVLGGFLSDKFGRRNLYSIGFFIISMSFFMYPFCRNVFPELLIARLMFSVGSSLCTGLIIAGLNDVVKPSNNTKKSGLVSGLTGTCSSIGALFAVFVLFNLPLIINNISHNFQLSIKLGFIIVGLVALFISVFVLVFYKKHNNETGLENNSDNITSNKEKLKNYILNTLSFTAKCFCNLNIMLGFLSGFVARGDTIILRTYVPLWSYEYFKRIGECTAIINNTVDVKKDCRIAYSIAMKFTGISDVFVLIGALIFGYSTHRYGALKILVISSLVASVGYFMFGLNSTPKNNINILYVILIGLGEIATIVTSMSFLSTTHKTKNDDTVVDPQINAGKISALYSAFGCFGIMVSSRIGGYLFDNWKPTAPFIVMGIMHTSIIIIAVTCVIIKKGLARNPHSTIDVN